METTNPYKGLFPYTADDEEYFFGREKETADMIEMIRNKQMGILYGESGSGKTSMIHAKLFPELKRRYYFPVYIRLNFLNKVDPMTQLREKMNAQLKEWDDEAPVFEDNVSLIDFAGRNCFFGGLVKPILFFDQFEEIFTLGQKYVEPAIINNFLDEIANVVECRIPAIDYKSESNNSKTVTEINKDTYRENVMRYTIVFSLRQDYIAQLDDLRFIIPSVVHHRCRIRKFNDGQARDAIICPAEVYVKKNNGGINGHIIDPATANEIIDQLKQNEKLSGSFKDDVTPTWFKKYKIKQGPPAASSHIIDTNAPKYNIELDPTILSLYCQQLYEKAPIGSNGLKEISVDQVKELPCSKIIEHYYKSSIPGEKIRKATENMLITPDGKRTIVLLKDFSERSNISPEEIEELRQRTGIFRTYGEGDKRELEIAHDQIAKRVLKSRKIREANRVKLVTTSFALVTIALCIVGLFYVREQRKRVDVNALLARVDKISQENGQLDSILGTKETALISLQKEYINLENSNKGLRGEYSSSKDLAEKYGDLIKNYDARVSTLERKVKESDNQITRLNTTIKAEQEQRAVDNLNKDRIINGLKDEVQKVREENNSLERENQRLKGANMNLRDSLKMINTGQKLQYNSKIKG